MRYRIYLKNYTPKDSDYVLKVVRFDKQEIAKPAAVTSPKQKSSS
jgi:hypothetical protein